MAQLQQTLLFPIWKHLMRKSYLIITFVLFMVPALSGCGIIDYFYLPPGEDTAQELFEAGNDAMREKDYVVAAEYYTKLKESHPFSPYAIEAELSLADAYFLDEEWAEASEAYKEFDTLHPRHEAVPYVLYQVGIANMHLYPSVDRATQPVQEAYSYFQRLKESYSNTEYGAQAEAKMLECRVLLAKHELYVGDFYYRMGKYGSALSRYREVEKKYSDIEEAYVYAKDKAKAAFLEDKKVKAQATTEKRDGSWKQNFDWL